MKLKPKLLLSSLRSATCLPYSLAKYYQIGSSIRSTENPPDMLNRSMPKARPEDNIIATAESAGIFVE